MKLFNKLSVIWVLIKLTCSYTTNRNMKLNHLNGDILDIETDFIINASNTTLRLGSGVSMSLKRACGPELQKSMDDIRSELNGKGKEINPGDVFATPSFEHANSNYVLHSAVINYNDGVKQFEGKPTLKTIETILENTIPYIEWFNETHNHEPTLTFPYLGCGVGGLDMNDVKKVFNRFGLKYKDQIGANINLVQYAASYA